MNDTDWLNGDLSEEVLSEDVSASCVNVSKGLISNMGDNPFNRKVKGKQLLENSHLSIRHMPEFKDFADEKFCNKKLLCKGKTKTFLNSFASQSCPRQSKLQTEIKDLLHKMIKLKSSPMSTPYSLKASKKSSTIPLCEEALVTVNDIQSRE
ncbi:unnamed protein product [Moneuplotes crassus]|uniref:Uncharacterized protein n=1 Tax=Euplotes crassus TaxID=5936 RepID=A0AAD1Y8F0_EUPCR|nr:unnamed protein product [Moneuplotes crassus]